MKTMTRTQAVHAQVQSMCRRDGGPMVKVDYTDRKGGAHSLTLCPYDAWVFSLEAPWNGLTITATTNL